MCVCVCIWASKAPFYWVDQRCWHSCGVCWSVCHWLETFADLYSGVDCSASSLQDRQYVSSWSDQAHWLQSVKVLHGPFCPAALASQSHKTLEKHSESRLFYLFARRHLLSSDFFLLWSSSLSLSLLWLFQPLLFHLFILLEVWLLNFLQWLSNVYVYIL